MFKTMLKLKIDADLADVVIRYKDHVIVAEFFSGPEGEFFCPTIWAPIETEEETGLEFHELRLENVTPWEPLTIEACFDTEGEALFAAMQAVEGGGCE